MVKNKAKPNDHDDADNEDEEVAQVGSKENAGKKGKMKDKGKKREDEEGEEMEEESGPTVKTIRAKSGDTIKYVNDWWQLHDTDLLFKPYDKGYAYVRKFSQMKKTEKFGLSGPRLRAHIVSKTTKKEAEIILDLAKLNDINSDIIPLPNNHEVKKLTLSVFGGEDYGKAVTTLTKFLDEVVKARVSHIGTAVKTPPPSRKGFTSQTPATGDLSDIQIDIADEDSLDAEVLETKKRKLERAAKPERPGKRQKADLTKAREDMLAKVKDEMDQYYIGTTSVPVMKLRPGGKYNPRKLDNARVMEIAKSMANSYSMYSDTGIAVVEGDYATTTQEEKDALLHALRDTESGVVGYLAGGQHARAAKEILLSDIKSKKPKIHLLSGNSKVAQEEKDRKEDRYKSCLVTVYANPPEHLIARLAHDHNSIHQACIADNTWDEIIGFRRARPNVAQSGIYEGPHLDWLEKMAANMMTTKLKNIDSNDWRVMIANAPEELFKLLVKLKENPEEYCTNPSRFHINKEMVDTFLRGSKTKRKILIYTTALDAFTKVVTDKQMKYEDMKRTFSKDLAHDLMEEAFNHVYSQDTPNRTPEEEQEGRSLKTDLIYSSVHLVTSEKPAKRDIPASFKNAALIIAEQYQYAPRITGLVYDYGTGFYCVQPNFIIVISSHSFMALKHMANSPYGHFLSILETPIFMLVHLEELLHFKHHIPDNSEAYTAIDAKDAEFTPILITANLSKPPLRSTTKISSGIFPENMTSVFHGIIADVEQQARDEKAQGEKSEDSDEEDTLMLDMPPISVLLVSDKEPTGAVKYFNTFEKRVNLYLSSKTHYLYQKPGQP